MGSALRLRNSSGFDMELFMPWVLGHEKQGTTQWFGKCWVIVQSTPMLQILIDEMSTGSAQDDPLVASIFLNLRTPPSRTISLSLQDIYLPGGQHNSKSLGHERLRCRQWIVQYIIHMSMQMSTKVMKPTNSQLIHQPPEDMSVQDAQASQCTCVKSSTVVV